ncbi:MAG: tetratricopeptide repeat protein [Bacteroidia bacterium]
MFERKIGHCLTGLAITCCLLWVGCGGKADSKSHADAQGSSLPPTTSSLDTVPDALQRYAQILRSDPNNIPALGKRGRLLWSLGRLQEARRDFTVILEIDPSNIAALNDRARLLTEMGQDREALYDWEDLLLIQPLDPMVRSGLGNVFLRMGRTREALEQFKYAIQIAPGREDLLLNAAAAEYQLGNFEGARLAYQEILAMNPQSAEALNGIGLITQFVDSDETLAEQNYRQALALDPNLAGAWFNIAFLEAGRGLNMKAIEDFGNAIRLDSTYIDARLNRGLLYINDRQPERAVPDLEWITRRRPDHGHAWLLLGWAHCLSHDGIKGCLELSKAKELKQAGAEKLMAEHCK